MINCPFSVRCSVYIVRYIYLAACDPVWIFRLLCFPIRAMHHEVKAHFYAIKTFHFVTILMEFRTKCIFIVGACCRLSHVDPNREFSFGFGKNGLHEKYVSLNLFHCLAKLIQQEHFLFLYCLYSVLVHEKLFRNNINNNISFSNAV